MVTVYNSRKIAAPKPNKYNLVFKVPMYSSFEKRTEITLYNDQYGFIDKFTTQPGKWMFLLTKDDGILVCHKEYRGQINKSIWREEEYAFRRNSPT